jgi:hypothetical protein
MEFSFFFSFMSILWELDIFFLNSDINNLAEEKLNKQLFIFLDMFKIKIFFQIIKFIRIV